MPVTDLPAALHRGEHELPFVDLSIGATPGTDIQLLRADVEHGVWAIRVRFAPGAAVQRHRHTGDVHAFTLAGRWKYAEYPEVNVAGSYLYEPAGSIHTSTVPADNDEITDACFVINGANLNLDEAGTVIDIVDAGVVLARYRDACARLGLGEPDVIGAPAPDETTRTSDG